MKKPPITEKERVEIWLSKSVCRKIENYVCKDGEKRKQAIERVITNIAERNFNSKKKLTA